jgi:hypothetical protein
MAIEELSAGSSGVARLSQRPVKNALISNTDNPAVQQYAQVSHFTSFLADAPAPVQQNQNAPEKAETRSASSDFDSFFGTPSNTQTTSSASSEPAASVLNYSARGTTNPVQNPNQAGKFISLSV